MSERPRIDECGLAERVTPASMDALWSQGWRHQGALLFRYSHCVMQGVEHDIIPLRIQSCLLRDEQEPAPCVAAQRGCALGGLARRPGRRDARDV